LPERKELSPKQFGSHEKKQILTDRLSIKKTDNMKAWTKELVGILSLLLLAASSQASPTRDSAFQHWITHTEEALFDLQFSMRSKQIRTHQDLQVCLRQVLGAEQGPGEQWLRLYRKQVQLERTLTRQMLEGQLMALKVRYRKGIDLIKLLYEKILALDHHFSSMQTYQHILQLSNPNAYPEFQSVKALLDKKLKRKYSIHLPEILSSNPYVSMTYSIVASLLGEGESEEKEKDLESMSCILDFTVRMNADLKIIRHETEYLQKANQQLKQACERLFADYVNVVDYLVPLENCRNQDDWEKLYLKLDQFTEELEQDVPIAGNNPAFWGREQINLEFATQRVAEFISQYSQFINQGIQYYQKFNNIVANYEYEDQCRSELPRQFEELRADILHTIEKFQNTYDLPEIQGSRMKDLLYGQLE
jgi:hypothetical protein